MKITNSKLRKVIREALTLTETKMIDIIVNEYESVEDFNILANYALNNDMQGALADPELQYYIEKNEAGNLVDDAMTWLPHVGDDEWGMPAPAGWDFNKIKKFTKDFENAAYLVYDKKSKAASKSAPNNAERKAIGAVFTFDDILPKEIKSITYQVRRKGGKPRNIQMEDHDGMLGNMYTNIDVEEAQRYGTTLDKIIKVLEDNGARLRKKQKSGKRTTPYYD